MSISLNPSATLHDEVYQRLLSTLKEFSGSVYNINTPIVVPYSFFGTAFDLTGVVPGSKIEIIIRKLASGGEDPAFRISVIPTAESETVLLPLGEGTNIIEISVDGEKATEVKISALHLAAPLEAESQEIFQNIELLLNEVEDAILSPIGARLVEFNVDIHDLLPDARTYRQLCTKLAIRAIYRDPGTQRGVEDFLTAITTNTPIFVRERLDDTEFNPIQYPLLTAQEHFGGWDAHVWIPNRCIVSWLAFIKLMNNVDVYDLEQVTEIITTHRENTEFVVVGAGQEPVSGVDLVATGAGYLVGDLLTVVGGGFISAAVIEVVTVTAITGEIEEVSINDSGSYLTRPEDPVAITGGAGASATFNLTFPDGGAKIVNPGFGYTTGDLLTVVEGAFNFPTVLEVDSVTVTGEIEEVRVKNAGSYIVKPVDPVTVTGGTGTGVTFDLTFIAVDTRVVRHQFAENFDAPGCSLQDLIVTCFDKVSTFLEMHVRTSGKMCIGYPLDTEVQFCDALGVRYFDCDEELDSGTLDTVEAEDPTGDGFVGYPLDLRLDGSVCFDTYPSILHKTPAAWDDCCYLYGHAVTPLNINFSEVEIDAEVGIDVALLVTAGLSPGLGPILSEV